MSPEVERLMGRAVTNEEFRKQLLADPEVTIQSGGFNLTPEEVDRVKKGIERFKNDQVLNAQVRSMAISVW